MTQSRPKQVLVAGIGNAWMKDDAFGGEVAARLQARKLPPGVSVFDFGTGGLNLAYEVMRGYDALILVDISRQGGEPGTLYIMEPEEDSVDPSLDNGEVIDPHGMDPETVLRFVKGVGGWPGKVVVIACEPMEVEEMGLGLSEPVQSSLDRAADLVAATASELLTDAAYEQTVEGSRDA